MLYCFRSLPLWGIKQIHNSLVWNTSKVQSELILPPIGSYLSKNTCSSHVQSKELEHWVMLVSLWNILFFFRDALIASVLDGVRASGNRDVHVKMKFTNRGYRLGKLTVTFRQRLVKLKLHRNYVNFQGQMGASVYLCNIALFCQFRSVYGTSGRRSGSTTHEIHNGSSRLEW